MTPELATSPPRSILRRLAEVKTEPDGVLSVYVDLDPSVVPTLKDRAMSIEALIDEAKRAFVDGVDLSRKPKAQHIATIDRLRETLDDRDIAKGGARTVAVFAAPSEDVFEVLALPSPVAQLVVVDDTPYLRPIVDDVGPRRWVVALVDRRHARILFGGVERLTEIESIEDNVPSHQKQGGWSQSRYQRHSDNAAHEHIEHATRRLLELYERVRFEALAIASPDGVYDEVVEALHPYLKDVFEGRVSIEVDFPTPTQVLEAAQSLFDEVHKRAINELLATIDEAARERVALGPQTVLEALSERRVDTLIIDGEFSTPGVRCPKDGWTGVEGATCPWDESPLEKRPDIVDDAVDLALLQAARVVRVDRDAERHPKEPLSALLRY